VWKRAAGTLIGDSSGACLRGHVEVGEIVEYFSHGCVLGQVSTQVPR
jgi:hypothetical protein